MITWQIQANMVCFIFYRAQVNELWSRGDRVTCGVISEDTRVSFICQYEPPANPHSTDNSKLEVTLNDNLASADCYSRVMSFNCCQTHAITVKHI